MIPKRLLVETILAVHDRLIKDYGGVPGVRDIRLVHSALVRPGQAELLGDMDIYDIAAAYGSGLIRYQCFYDLNKPTAYVAMKLFLELNGRRLVAPKSERVAAMLAVAMGEWQEADLAEWLSENTVVEQLAVV